MTNNPFINAQNQIKKLAELVNLDNSVVAQLIEPNRVLEVNFPVTMDDGSIKMFKGLVPISEEFA